ncbi:GNAT family N-acetyltransferase [Pseudomonas batumici]|uniref:Acetyltransferase, GNAT family n=1 Tax=Pseudomonas batumici TaxID=226910 RepID=A0A0C2HY60_9PSED|nr:GNAT family N-acetyltransferase [Pseudomonas batumici]KIH82066.1 Acetyltransferase, GNAT family [Pseudomonas batumici]
MRTDLVDYVTLTPTQREQLGLIQVDAAQKEFSSDIAQGLAVLHAHTGNDVKGFVLLADELPVGFLLLKRPPASPTWATGNVCTLHGLQVDKSYQGRGLGRACMQALPAAALAAWPATTHLMLMVDADNDTARGLYLKQGFVDSGETFHGRVGEERRLALPL